MTSSIKLANRSHVILLDKAELSKRIVDQGFEDSFNLEVFPCIDSTNRYLKELPLKSVLTHDSPQTQIKLLNICCAEMQTNGRGRFNRHWHSPLAENIYCSSLWHLRGDLSKVSGLSLITSLAVVKTINEFCPSIKIKIKWPNDILWQDKKLCGNLIELITDSPNHARIVIGIGLNVNTDTINQILPDKPWCSLYEITQQYYNRNIIIAQLIVNLNHYIQKFITTDLNNFMDEWQNYDYLNGKCIIVNQALDSISGIARGINSEGLLQLEDEEGVIHYLSSGDTTLKDPIKQATAAPHATHAIFDLN